MANEIYMVDVCTRYNDEFVYQNYLITEDESLAREVYEDYAPTADEPRVELWRIGRKGVDDLDEVILKQKAILENGELAEIDHTERS